VGQRTAVGAAIGYVALAISVRAGVLDGLDARLRQVFRPDDVWGPVQWKADIFVEGLRPALVVPAVGLVVAMLCVIRRSVWPALLVAGTGLLNAALILGTKVAVGRPDPHQTPYSHGGSFPSGHTATVIVFLGLAVYLLRPDGGWWRRLVPGIAGLAMGLGLVIEAAHWATDVVGGGLLGVAVLGVLCGVDDGRSYRWPRRRRRAGPSRDPEVSKTPRTPASA
jgi:membrane-associated phospholipid phosphatase